MTKPSLHRETYGYRGVIPLELPPSATFCWSTGGNMTLPKERIPLTLAGCFETEYPSDDVIVVGDVASSTYILAGAVTAQRSLTHFTAVRHAGRLVAVNVWQPDIAPDGVPEEVLVLQGTDWRDLLVRYADEAARRNGAIPHKGEPNLTGYCTWYYYYADVTSADFFENLEIIKRSQTGPYRSQVVQIDDGYQTFQGDWLSTHASWPVSMEEVAHQITSAGLQAGIWLMPFQASTASQVFRDHPDWFVKGEDGQPSVSQGWSPPPDDQWACLDLTHPEVLEHLAHVFQTFYKWGFTYFKMDGLGFALKHGGRHDPAATPVSAFRQGMAAIRKAVPDAFLLSCCPPQLLCLGYADMSRVSNDTKADWTQLASAARTSMSRWWMVDRWFRCDPDVVVVRTDRGDNTLGASHISALAGILTGVSLTSDKLDVLPPDRLALLGRAAALRMLNPRPILWKVGEWESAFEGTVDGQPAVALFNYTEAPRTWKFAEFGRGETATELLQPMGEVSSEITLLPHDAALLQWEA